MWRGISAFKGVVPQVTASGCDQHNTATRLHVGTPLRLEPDPGLEFGTVLLGRTLDAETSEHDLQERYDNRDSATCCRITIGRRGALASWQAGKLPRRRNAPSRARRAGRVGDPGVADVQYQGLPLIALKTVRGVERAFN